MSVLLLVLGSMAYTSFAQQFLPKKEDIELSKGTEQEIRELMADGKIPGLSLVMVRDGRQVTKSYGYADIGQKRLVTPATLFQLGSCSKAFTALAVQRLLQGDSLRLNAAVSEYLPSWTARYKDSVVPITLLQLLHHTSGIPWQTISSIPEANDPDALERTIKNLTGLRLKELPGKKYEYATVNYDILALIIQQVTRQPFEIYLQQQVIDALSLSHTTIGSPSDSSLMAEGYKIGLFRPRRYDAPVYRGNNAAGYVISDAQDMAQWLKFQLGESGSSLYGLAKNTHQRDETAPLHGMASYAMGWDVSLSGNGEIHHDGLNPNFTTYIAFQPDRRTGVVVLANSNSGYTHVIGDKVLKLLTGEEQLQKSDPGDGSDKAFSLIAIIIAAYILTLLAFLLRMTRDIVKRRRVYSGQLTVQLGKWVRALLMVLPFLYGIYILPAAIAGFTWNSIFVWTPVSFKVLCLSMLTAISFSYLLYLASLLFPEKDPFKRIAPRILLISILSGVSNMILILLVTSALNTDIKLKYLVFYYVLALSLYLLGTRFVQVNLIKFTRGLIYDLRIRLIERIFSTSYQQFEKMDRGRVYTALNGDVETLGGSADQFIALITNVFTAAGAFLYLASIAFWTAILTIALILIITVIYYLVSRGTRIYFQQARDTQNVFMRLVNGMIDGFKEISLHSNKKREYKEDIASTARQYRDKISTAGIHFANAFLVGESSLIFLLGMVVFAIPELFPDIHDYTIMSFVIVVLYLIGPVNAILRSVPAIMQLRIAWSRLQQFSREIPANLPPGIKPAPIDPAVDSLRAENILFQYTGEREQNGFGIGPVTLEVRRGEILFIIGGNGSGKTTFAKLLTGLYKPDEGRFLVNNKEVEGPGLSEYFSTVFTPAHLFEKLYNIDVTEKAGEVKKYLDLLDLTGKVTIAENKYSTINLSGGQRKRLALLQCYLEDSPIYLFDEWAADQDPGYRNFFYRTLLPEMSRKGKIIIAITHDDHYFDVADKVLKMKDGKLEPYDGQYPFSAEVYSSGINGTRIGIAKNRL